MKKSKKFMVQIRVVMGVMLACVLLVGLCGVLTTSNLGNRKDAIYNEYVTGYENYLTGSVCLLQAVSDIRQAASEVSDETIGSCLSDAAAKMEHAEAYFDTAKEAFQDEEILNLLAQFRTQSDAFGSKVTQATESYAGGSKDFSSAVSSADEIAAAVEGIGTQLSDLADTKMTAEETSTKTYVQNAMLFLTLASFFALIFGIIMECYMVRAIKRPLRILTGIAEKLAVGDVNIKIEPYKNDEFGELIDKFKIVINNIHAQAEIASQVAVGDLTVDVNINSSEDLLGNALDKLVDEHNGMMSNIREASMQVMTGADQVAAASQSLAQGSTQQASAIEQVTASISDIAERTRENTEQMNEANDLVHNTKDSAMHGNEQMKEMISAMSEINESSENISKIIKVIDDIAFQTNILALNAAVEAARAGAHGKGFAVVAEEVRNLAGKSAEAASETAEMIEDSIRKVERGSQLATETAKALDAIVAEVEHIVTITNHVAVAFNEQATAVAQIDQAISQVSTVVQTNSATSEECAAASEELSNQAAKLKDLVSKYRLKSSYTMGDSGFGYQGSSGSTGSFGSSGSFSIGTRGDRGTSSVPNIPTIGSTNYQPNDENEKIIALGDGFGKY
jgi:methyl-accepting chemotaxis protein